MTKYHAKSAAYDGHLYENIKAAEYAAKTKRASIMHSEISEWEIHKAVVNRLRYRRDLLAWHTPNGGYRGTIEAMQFQRAGVMPGVSDLIILQRGKPPLAWELKAEKGKLSTSQERYLKNVESYGWDTLVTYGMGQAMKVLEEI